MCDTVVQDGVGESNSSVVHPSGTIWQDSESQILALERWDGNIAQRSREDDVVGDDVVLENFLEGGLVC